MNNTEKETGTLSIRDILELDVQKLHSEVNQLRNNESLVNSFAIAMVVVSLSVVKEPKEEIAIAMLFLLGAIHYWQYTLLDIRTRITTYLISSGLSNWEEKYRHFSSIHPDPSMRFSNTILFIALGSLTLVASYDRFPYCYFSIYTILILFFGQIFIFINERIFKVFNCIKGQNYIVENLIEKYKDTWGKIIRNESVHQSSCIEPLLMTIIFILLSSVFPLLLIFIY